MLLIITRITSLITLRNDPSGGRSPAQIPQLDKPHASNESHNSYTIDYMISIGLISLAVLVRELLALPA